jgi:hypothetical protein
MIILATLNQKGGCGKTSQGGAPALPLPTRVNLIKTIPIFILAFGLLGCISPEEQNRQLAKQVTQQAERAWQPFMEREQQWYEDLKLYKQHVQDYQTGRNKYEKEKSNFLASLTDEELKAYSAYNQAEAAKDDPGIILTSRKLVSLLEDSGKLKAFQQLNYHMMLLGIELYELNKEEKELEARGERLSQDEDLAVKMYQNSMQMSQYQQMLDALQGINNSLWDMKWQH